MSLDHGMMELINFGEIDGLQELEIDLAPEDLFMEDFQEDIINETVEKVIKSQTQTGVIDELPVEAGIAAANTKTQDKMISNKIKEKRKIMGRIFWSLLAVAAPLFIIFKKEKRNFIFFILSISISCNNIQMFYGIKYILSSFRDAPFFMWAFVMAGIFSFLFALNASFATLVLAKTYPIIDEEANFLEF